MHRLLFLSWEGHMIGVLLLSHGKLAEGVYETLKLFYGENLEQVSFLGLYEDGETDIESYENNVRKAIRKLNDGSGVVVLTDLLGGTPYNKSSLFRKKDVVILSGLNLNMALEVMGRRNRAEKVSEMNLGLIAEESRKGITVLEG